MKKLLYVLFALVVLLVAAVLLGPSLIDWNAYKSEIAARIERATGREVTIAGDISLSVLPAPAFSASGVRIANVAGGSAPTMAAVKALRVRTRLAPLLQGRIEVEKVVLVEPEILLETLPDGRSNWHLAGPSPGRDETARDGPLLRQVRLDSFQIADGTLVYRDAPGGIEERITDIDAELSADSLRGPFAARGTLTTRDVRLSFDAGLGRLGSDGQTPYKVTARLPETPARAALSGSISLADAGGAALQGTLEVKGDDLAATLRRLGLGSATAPQLAHAFAATADINAGDGSLSARNLDLRLGEISADGEVDVAFAKPLDIDAGLHVQQINLDRLLAMSSAAGAGTAGEDSTGATGPAASGEFVLPDDIRASLDLQLDALIYRGQVVRQGRLNAVLADGTVTLNQAMALLPGGSDLALFGTFGGEGGRATFDGRVEAASDNLRAILDWFGISVEGVRADRLRRMSLLADVKGTPRQLTATGIDLDIDTMEISGGVAVALRRRPGFGIGLSVDKLNLDAYLPQGDDAGGTGADGAAEPAESAGGPPLTALLGGFDANFDLRAGTLTYAGRTARDLHLDATLQKSRLTVREARIGRFAGSSLMLAGKASGLQTLQPGFDFDMDLQTADPQTLAEAFDHGEAVPSGLGSMSLTGKVAGTPAALSLDLAMNALGGEATAKGDVQPLESPLAFTVATKVRHPDIKALAERLEAARVPSSGLGGIDLAAGLSGTTAQFRAQDLKGRVGPVDLAGDVAVDLAGSRPMFRANLDTGELPVQAFALGGRAGKASTKGASGNGAEEAGDAPASRNARWSDQPIDTGMLRGFDALLTLRADAMTFGEETRLEQAALDASLEAGVLDIESLSGNLFGGTLKAQGTADLREMPTMGVGLTAKEVDSAPLLTRGFDFDRVSGPVSLETELNAKGRSERALVQSLNGKGRLSGTLTFKTRPEDQATGLMLNLLGQKIKELRGVAETTGTLLDAFAGQPAQLEGTFQVADGVVRTRDTTLQGQGARATVQGRANLPNWRLDAEIGLLRKQDPPDSPFMTTLLRGPLDRPNTTVKGGPFRPRKGDRGSADTPKSESEPEPEPKSKPKQEEAEPKPEKEPEAEAKPRASEETEVGSGPEPEPEGGTDDAEAEATADKKASQPAAPKRPSAEDIVKGVLEKLQKQAE